MSVTRDSVLEELEVDVFVCFSWKIILDTPRFGTKGIGGVMPIDPPETLPGAAEYAMAKSTFKPINCAFAGEARKRNRNIKKQDNHILKECFVLLSIQSVYKNLEIKPDAKTHDTTAHIVFASGFNFYF